MIIDETKDYVTKSKFTITLKTLRVNIMTGTEQQPRKQTSKVRDKKSC